MNLAEILVISVGLSFDVFAVMICEGAMLVRVEKKKLICMGLIFCGWQLAAVLVGNLITLIPPFQNSSNGLQKVWDGLSVVIFMALGAYMLYKAWKNEPVFETRSAVNYRSTCVVAMATSLDAFLYKNRKINCIAPMSNSCTRKNASTFTSCCTAKITR